MRQAGVLAAAGLIALEETPEHLPEDHANAQFLAEGLAGIPGIRSIPQGATNIVVFDVPATGKTPAADQHAIETRAVLINGINDRQMRAVTHYDVTREDCAHALGALAEACVVMQSPKPNLKGRQLPGPDASAASATSALSGLTDLSFPPRLRVPALNIFCRTPDAQFQGPTLSGLCHLSALQV